jgi:GntR family transcriptional regulator
LLPLDRSSPLPLYAQLKQRLVALLARPGEPGRRFYSDDELVEMFQVSRDTARQAVAELVREGLLTRERGRGTFVSGPGVEERFNSSLDFEQQWASRGTPMQVAGLVFERRPAGAEIAKLLEVAPDDRILLIRRVRLAARIPIALDDRYLPADLTADWGPETIEHSFLHRLWRSHPLAQGDFVITAGIAASDEQEHLQLEPGTAVLIREPALPRSGRPLRSGRTHRPSGGSRALCNASPVVADAARKLQERYQDDHQNK